MRSSAPIWNSPGARATETDEAAFAGLFAKLERERGFRGALYRQKCVRRRIAVRVRARRVASVSEYAALLDSDPAEYDLLLRALTINVTRFFRNPETWDVIRRRIIPGVVENRPLPLMWSVGAATGEEAYSLAIAVREYLEGRVGSRRRRVRIIGTDIDAESLAAARLAEYEPYALAETTEEVRVRWFTGERRQRLVREIRECVEFRLSDVLSGSPGFTADLILCRNLLIYLNRDAQARVFDSVLEALRPGGYLVLGRVETLGESVRPLFDVLDLRERVYRKR